MGYKLGVNEEDKIDERRERGGESEEADRKGRERHIDR